MLVLDRFSGERLDAIDLPGPAKGLRGDRFGQWLLVRPAAATRRGHRPRPGAASGALTAEWADDLPAVASPNTLLVRKGNDVVALDLGAKGFPRPAGSPRRADEWVPLAWRPARDVEADGDRHEGAGRRRQRRGRRVGVPAGQQLQNPAWASELAEKLRGRRPASVGAGRRRGATRRIASCSDPSLRASRPKRPAGIGMPSFVVSGAARRPADHRRRPRRTHTSIGRTPA